jgi:heme/copper-type cytochrome/quinol oxidase subunit 3
MKPLTYFRACLLLPLLIPLIALPFGTRNAPGAVLIFSVIAAGVPYLFFAVAMWFYLARQSQAASMPRSILFAPLLFLPVEAIVLTMWSVYLHGARADTMIGVLVLLPLLSLYTLVVGYVYVGLVSLIYALLREAGYIQVTSATSQQKR